MWPKEVQCIQFAKQLIAAQQLRKGGTADSYMADIARKGIETRVPKMLKNVVLIRKGWEFIQLYSVNSSIVALELHRTRDILDVRHRLPPSLREQIGHL